MTLLVAASTWGPYTGTGSNTVFTFSGRIDDASHLNVYVKDTVDVEVVLSPSLYTVSGIGVDSGGTVTLLSPLTLNYELTIKRIAPLTQTFSFKNQGKFNAEFHEDAFDRVVMLVQQLQEQVTRALATIPSTAVQDMLNQTAAIYDQFDDRYLGSKTSDPTLDNDGNALVTGAIYFNSVSNVLKVYNGSTWITGVTADISALTLTNKTGGSLAVGDVVTTDTATSAGVVLADTLKTRKQLLVSLDAPASDVSGRFASIGHVTVKVTGTVTRGNYLVKSATTKVAQDSGVAQANSVNPPAGAFAVATSPDAAGTCTARLLGFTVQSSSIGAFGSVRNRGGNNAGTPNTQYDLDCDIAVLRNSDNEIVVIHNPGAALTNNISTAGPAVNGRDQAGAFSNNSWIHFFRIYNGTTLATISSDTTTPELGPDALPGGYTYWEYVMTVRLDGSGNLVKTHLQGNAAFYDANINVLASGSASTETTINLATQIPPNALTIHLGARVHANLSAGADPVTLTIRFVTGLNAHNISGRSTASIAQINDSMVVVPNLGQQVFYLLNTSVNALADVNVHGYTVANGGS